MLFYSFHSQLERREFGGADFIEIQYCRLAKGTSIRKIVSVDAISHWKDDSLYICGDDMERFYQHYGDIITGGIYNNGDCGPMNLWGINFYSRDQANNMIERLAEKKPPEYQILCRWLRAGEQYLGFYLLGV